MATKQRRHTCINCGRKLVESKMERYSYSSWYSCRASHWKCQNNCSKTDTLKVSEFPGENNINKSN